MPLQMTSQRTLPQRKILSMASSGNPFETPGACPFVALELDRDKRADKPDYRHRCFAEPTPAPRSIAHQEAYCLSPKFSACPVFQDWAVRAAARPVNAGGAGAAGAAAGAAVARAAAQTSPPEEEQPEDTTPPAAATAPSDWPTAQPVQQPESAPDDQAVPAIESPGADSFDPAAGQPVDAAQDWTASAAAEPPDQDSVIADLPEDASVTTAGAEIAAAAAATTGMSPALASPPTFATTGWEAGEEESEQLGAFDVPPEPYSSYGEPDARYGEPDAGDPEPPVVAGYVPPPAKPGQPAPASEPFAEADAAVPGFLAGRSSRQPAAASRAAATASFSGPPEPPRENVSRDEIVPSWEIDGRYGAEAPRDKGNGGGSRLDGVLTAIAVVAILALGIGAVVFLPGLLNKSPAHTPGPSLAIPSVQPSAVPSVLGTVTPSLEPSAQASAEPSAPASVAPVGSPRLYKIKARDTLAHIAKKFGVTVQDILDANLDITNPNNIFVGQIIVIPPAPGS